MPLARLLREKRAKRDPTERVAIEEARSSPAESERMAACIKSNDNIGLQVYQVISFYKTEKPFEVTARIRYTLEGNVH